MLEHGSTEDEQFYCRVVVVLILSPVLYLSSFRGQGDTQQMEGAKNRIFGVFEPFCDLYAPQKRRKHDTSLDFAAFLRQRKILTQKVPQKVPQKANFDKKIDEKMPQAAVPQTRRKI